MKTQTIHTIRITFKRKFLAGLVISIPIVLTLFVFFTLFRFIDGILGPFFDMILGKHFAGLGFVAVVAIVFLLGIVSTNVFGKKVLSYAERVFLHIPVFKSVYVAVKQLVDAFSPENTTSFKKFVIVEYPREGCYAFGFLTKECSIRKGDCTSTFKAIYIPTNNLYLGEVVLLDEKSIIYTSIPIDEGIKIVLSGGIAAPHLIVQSRGIGQ